MSKIFYLEGSRAVGKTTLLRNIRQNEPNFIVIDGHARKDFMFDITRLDEFIINEKLYLACDLAQYNVLKNERFPVFIVKGPYTDVFFAEKYMGKVFPHHNIKETDLFPYIEHVKKICVPDGIIYLDASLEVIKNRCAADSRLRKTMNEFLNHWLEDFEQYFKSMPLTRVVNTNDKDTMAVYHEVMRLIGEQ